jgi:glutamine synthetase
VSNVRSVLRQPLYRGIARWNRLKQHDEDRNPILDVNPKTSTSRGFDGSSNRGFQEIQESNMLLMPEPASVPRSVGRWRLRSCSSAT